MHRWEIIQALIDRFGLKSYLEIGVFQGENFNKIRCELKHSVDPEFPATFQMTSKDFFIIKCPQRGMKQYDLVFVDGLHTEDQAYRDIWNAMWLLSPKIIVVHDCNPRTKWHTRPPEQYKRGEEWNGTTYRGFIRYKQENPKKNCFVVDADYGCGIICDESIDLIENQIFSEDWEWFDRNRNELLQLVNTTQFLNTLHK
jgi:hypothetical protein